MKKLFNYIILFLFCMNCCSKAPVTEAMSNDAENATAIDSSSINSGEIYDETVNPPPVSAPKPEAVIADDGEQNTSVTPVIKTMSKKDSVHFNIKKINKTLTYTKPEIINPNISKVLPQNTDHSSVASPESNNSTSTGSEIPAEDTPPRNAVLGFSYFPTIAQNETRDLRVFVKIEGDGKQVTNKLKQIEKEDLEFTKTNDSSIVCIVKNIEAFKKLSIKPIYDTEDFKITRVEDDVQGFYDTDPNEQTLDFKNGNYWHWKIKAIAKSAHVGNITLLIKAETPEGQKIKLAERQISIKIGIDEPKLSFGQKTYQFADAHFKEILSLIIIPFALYLFTLLKKKFAAKKEDDPNEKSI